MTDLRPAVFPNLSNGHNEGRASQSNVGRELTAMFIMRAGRSLQMVFYFNRNCWLNPSKGLVQLYQPDPSLQSKCNDWSGLNGAMKRLGY